MAMEKDQREAIRILALIVGVVVLAAVAVVFLAPDLARIGTELFGGGLGLKDSAILAFFVTLILFVIFAVVSGDGLIGEVQFLIGGFAAFFFVIWLMIAWIF